MQEVGDGSRCGFLCLLVAMILTREFELRTSMLLLQQSPCDNYVLKPALHKLDIEAMRLKMIHLAFLTSCGDKSSPERLSYIEAQMRQNIPKTLSLSQQSAQ